MIGWFVLGDLIINVYLKEFQKNRLKKKSWMEILTSFCVKCLAALLFSTLFFLHACSATESLMYSCLWEGSRKAAHAKMIRKQGRSRKKQNGRNQAICKSCLAFLSFVHARPPDGHLKSKHI